ncbi:Hypothetical protein NocV09_09100100 [Nannochloropsis oceanica]
MFIKKLPSLLVLALCASNAAAGYTKTVNASTYALTTYDAAADKPLQVKPNTVYTIDKFLDEDYHIVIQCPQPKNGRMKKKGFITYLSYYEGFNDSGLEVYGDGSDDVQGEIWSAVGDPGYGSFLALFCTNGKLTFGFNYEGS